MENKFKFSDIFYNIITFFTLASIIYLSLTSRNMISSGVRNIDKVYHALAYGVLAFFLSKSVRTWGFRKAVPFISLISCAAIGGLLEIIQSKYGRMMEMNDFLADIAGAVPGTLLAKIRFKAARRT